MAGTKQKLEETQRERMDLSELRKVVEEVEMVDAHAHNIVSLDSNFAFIHAFSEADGHAVTFSPHTLSFKVTSLLLPRSITVHFLLHLCYVTVLILCLICELSLTEICISFVVNRKSTEEI